MACSCGKIKFNVNVEDGLMIINEIKTLPFESCIFCATKHLSYALILSEDYRKIGQMYLAYKHLGAFPNFAEKVFNKIKLYFDKGVIELNDLVSDIHQFASNNIDLKIENVELNYENENKLFSLEQVFLFVAGVNELYNFELGYKDVNTPYVIGLLQKAVEAEPFNDKKEIYRNMWKMIESDSLNEKNMTISLNFLKKRIAFYKNRINFTEILEKVNKRNKENNLLI